MKFLSSAIDLAEYAAGAALVAISWLPIGQEKPLEQSSKIYELHNIEEPRDGANVIWIDKLYNESDTTISIQNLGTTNQMIKDIKVTNDSMNDKLFKIQQKIEEDY